MLRTHRYITTSVAVDPVVEARPKRILVVDDNEDVAYMLSDALSLRGYEVRVVHDGALGLEAALSYAPDIALLDIGLPSLSGYQLAEAIRAAMGARCPRLIAITGYGQDSDRARAAAAGFAVHLVKPASLASVLHAFEPAATDLSPAAATCAIEPTTADHEPA